MFTKQLLVNIQLKIEQKNLTELVRFLKYLTIFYSLKVELNVIVFINFKYIISLYEKY